MEEIRFTKTYNIFDNMLLMEYISKTKPLWQNPPRKYCYFKASGEEFIGSQQCNVLGIRRCFLPKVQDLVNDFIAYIFARSIITSNFTWSKPFPRIFWLQKRTLCREVKYFLPISMQVESCEKQPETYMYYCVN